LKKKVNLMPDSIGLLSLTASMIKAPLRASFEEMEKPVSWKYGENDESDTKDPCKGRSG
jgi:hypothetical protein